MIARVCDGRKRRIEDRGWRTRLREEGSEALKGSGSAISAEQQRQPRRDQEETDVERAVYTYTYTHAHTHTIDSRRRLHRWTGTAKEVRKVNPSTNSLAHIQVSTPGMCDGIWALLVVVEAEK